METQDEMIVLVVVDDEEGKNISPQKNDIKLSQESGEVNNLVEMIKNNEESDVIVKAEPAEDVDWQYLENVALQDLMKTDSLYSSLEYIDSEDLTDDVFIPQLEYEELEQYDFDESSRPNKRHMLKPWERRSFVEELTKEYPELNEDEQLLVNTLEHIMRSLKRPSPPRDYYIMNGVMFECIKCGNLSETVPAASRHYQEKHGQRYLVCFACGVDFRSTTNLYKHEKRCIAPDASIVLKARASCLGRKGRSRPYLRTTSPFSKANNKKAQFHCDQCSAVFMTRYNLQSHKNLHRGERPYRCHVCPCAYTSYSALFRHKKTHTDAQYICNDCNRSFKLKTALVSHMDTHKPLRKHGCSECSRRFAQRSALKLHIHRVHRNLPPPCGCQICPKRYNRMSLLKNHMKRAHGMTIMTRKMFFKSLPTMTDLELKQSKVILKTDNDFIDTKRPYNTEEMFKECKMENILPDFAENGKNSASMYSQEISNEEKTPPVFFEKINNEDKIFSSPVFCKEIGDKQQTSLEFCEEIGNEKQQTSSVLCEEMGNVIVKQEFLPYVKLETESLGENVIYIKNGEVWLN